MLAVPSSSASSDKQENDKSVPQPLPIYRLGGRIINGNRDPDGIEMKTADQRSLDAQATGSTRANSPVGRTIRFPDERMQGSPNKPVLPAPATNS